MRTINYNNLENNLEEYIDSVINNTDTLVVNKGSGAVIMSLEEYNALIETICIMSSPAMIFRIKNAEKNIESKQGKKVVIDNLWK